MPDTETSITTLAGIAYDCFESFTRDADPETTIYKLKDERPEWVYEMVRTAHGDFFPDDWRYEAIMDACGWIHDNDADEDSSEFADQNVDVYNAARVEWLGSSLYRAAYCDEAVSEGLTAPDADIYDRIGVGQYMELTEVYSLVYRAISEQADDDDDDDDDEQLTTCGACGLTWDDGKVTSMTPAPSARCPFEAWHHDDGTETAPEEVPEDWPVQPEQ